MQQIPEPQRKTYKQFLEITGKFPTRLSKDIPEETPKDIRERILEVVSEYIHGAISGEP